MPLDNWSNINDLTSQGRSTFNVTLSDSVDLIKYPKALIPLQAGNLAVVPVDGCFASDGTTPVTNVIIPVLAGVPFDAFRVKRVYATGTTVTNVVAVL